MWGEKIFWIIFYVSFTTLRNSIIHLQEGVICSVTVSTGNITRYSVGRDFHDLLSVAFEYHRFVRLHKKVDESAIDFSNSTNGNSSSKNSSAKLTAPKKLLHIEFLVVLSAFQSKAF
jgi:hypothetical protein